MAGDNMTTPRAAAPRRPTTSDFNVLVDCIGPADYSPLFRRQKLFRVCFVRGLPWPLRLIDSAQIAFSPRGAIAALPSRQPATPEVIKSRLDPDNTPNAFSLLRACGRSWPWSDGG